MNTTLDITKPTNTNDIIENITEIENKKKKKTLINIEDKNKKRTMINIEDKKKKKIPTMNNLDMKKKKRDQYSLDKKKKKIMGLSGIPWDLLPEKIKKRYKNDYMKDKLCGINYGNFIDIDVNDRTMYWGLGVEHEMQLFHKSKSGMKNTFILFDSQESTCYISGDKHLVGSCCKMQKPCFENLTDDDISRLGITKEEHRFLKNMQWELTGRQAKGCLPNPIIIKRTPILMPELITTNFTNRTIDSIANEIISLENKFIDIQMKNPYTKEKVNKYGKLTTHTCGSLSGIIVPKRPTIYSPEYTFEETYQPFIDYLGSYHITITLPFTSDMKHKDFVIMHRNMANQLQWLEPLLVCAFFSPTAESVGQLPKDKDTEGSFRVMNIGWGNFAGSNIRKMGTTGLDRGANIMSSWRKGLNFKTTKRLDECVSTTKPYYKKATTIHTGDFRTFGFEPDMQKCAELYRIEDCPKADGAPMKPPYGLEIRIFDHFPSQYLIQLLRIIVLVASNAQRRPARQHVYNDKRWIKALQDIMIDGWNSRLETKYVTALRYNFGLPINTNSTIAYDILKTIVHELFIANNDSHINKLMNENPDIEPILPEINRICWEMTFTRQYGRKMLNVMKEVFYKGEELTPLQFNKVMKETFGDEWSRWENDLNDVLYALETNQHIKLVVVNGIIKKIKILL